VQQLLVEGNALKQGGKFHEAESVLKRARHLAQDSLVILVVLHSLGQLYLVAEKHRRAIPILWKALDLNAQFRKEHKNPNRRLLKYLEPDQRLPQGRSADRSTGPCHSAW
jgi:tetratricopeptide (TPR) repeat protein